jgi:starch phosphorylase
MSGERFSLVVKPHIPAALARLEDLATNLIYSWDTGIRGIFYRLDKDLWARTGHNPKLFLRRVSQDSLDAAAKDAVFIQDFQQALFKFDWYLNNRHDGCLSPYINTKTDLVSYFCAEFGFHESLPIYSGGLGILAGDHCKAASDLGLPFVGVGLLYRQGYFLQHIDEAGHQKVSYSFSNFDELPIRQVNTPSGQTLEVEIGLPGRTLHLHVWQVLVGHISILLLDSDLDKNSKADREITCQLYGGDKKNRLLQEMVMGIGGTKVLYKLGLVPTVWHINEGHSAFQILERCKIMVQSGLEFHAALEVVAANTVFTTHTPVPAGHDIFNHNLIEQYFGDYVEALGISMEEFLRYGASPIGENGFNMTALALRGSRHHNGVSQIHGGVASTMESYVWPEVPPSESPIRFITNGIHVQTFLAREWISLFDLSFGGSWQAELTNPDYWSVINSIPDHQFWSVRQSLKARMLEVISTRVKLQHRRNGLSEPLIRRLTRLLDPTQADLLVLGFARRFATYKRATLIFSDRERLSRLLNNPERPAVIIFSGKAHPLDRPGQELIRQINEFSRMEEFEGKIIFVENYDLSISRILVAGVDVWLNTPEYPLEASGTSGQKAAINGVINLSVLDGWWGEAYQETNGWAITPHGGRYSPEFRDCEETNELMDLLEYEVFPLFYLREENGFSIGWIEKSKISMITLIPAFNAQRMVMDYVKEFYSPAIEMGNKLAENEYQGAKVLATWKLKVKEAWEGVSIQRLDDVQTILFINDCLKIDLAIELNGLDSNDIVVDCLLGKDCEGSEFVQSHCQEFSYKKKLEDGRALFSLSLVSPMSGLQFYKIRMYPFHRLLSQRFEMGSMLWLE